MKRSAFCEYCMKETEYKVKEMTRASILNETPIKYEGKIPFCLECNNEIFVSEVQNQNLKNLYDEYRNVNNILSTSELEDIMFKYNIDAKSLNVILDFEIGTIERYLNGDIISIEHSNILKKIYNNISYYGMTLKAHKDKIEPIDYSKSKKRIDKLEQIPLTEGKVESAVRYILNKCEDINSKALFILLYYVQSFYFVYNDSFLFEEEFYIDKKGVYLKSLKEKYDFYGEEKENHNIVSYENIELNLKEVKVIDSVIKYYGCYSNNILYEMVKSEAPWILTKKNFIYLLNSSTDISTENKGIIHKYLISAYFSGVKEQYIDDKKHYIENYCKDTFKKNQE